MGFVTQAATLRFLKIVPSAEPLGAFDTHNIRFAYALNVNNW
jgi:hypothetical protein